MAEIRKRLNDPDPYRAMAAMKLLIEKGDTAQRQVAIEHGFASTDPDMRLEAVRAVLDSKPMLIFRWTPVDDDVSPFYAREVGKFSGDIGPGDVARVPVQIVGYSDEEDCWRARTRGNSSICVARINAGELGFTFTSIWSQFDLDSQGRLVGTSNVNGTRVEAVADLTK